VALVAIINCSSKSDFDISGEKRHQQVARDRLYRACIEIVCEISFFAPLLVIHVGGFRALLGLDEKSQKKISNYLGFFWVKIYAFLFQIFV
jgi:hypothetical protein